MQSERPLRCLIQEKNSLPLKTIFLVLHLILKKVKEVKEQTDKVYVCYLTYQSILMGQNYQEIFIKQKAGKKQEIEKDEFTLKKNQKIELLATKDYFDLGCLFLGIVSGMDKEYRTLLNQDREKRSHIPAFGDLLGEKRLKEIFNIFFSQIKDFSKRDKLVDLSADLFLRLTRNYCEKKAFSIAEALLACQRVVDLLDHKSQKNTNLMIFSDYQSQSNFS